MTRTGAVLWAEVERLALSRLAGCRREARRKTRFQAGGDYLAALETELRTASVGNVPLQPLLALLAAATPAAPAGMEPPLGGGMNT